MVIISRFYLLTYLGDVTIQQRTRFVTSTFRSKVQLALDFRNRFVERPFLCQDLIEQGSMLVRIVYIVLYEPRFVIICTQFELYKILRFLLNSWQVQ